MRLLSGFLVLATISLTAAESQPLSPTALVAASEGKVLYVACATAARVLCLDTGTRKVSGFITTPAPPLSLALSLDEKRLFVTCAAPESKVCIVDIAEHKIVKGSVASHSGLK